MANKIIPDAVDAPPITHGVIREMRDRIYELENRLTYNASDQGAGNRGVDATTQSLSEQVKNLAGRLTKTWSAPSVSTGSLPNDNLFHDYGSPVSINIHIPEGCQIVATWGCSQVTLSLGAVGAGMIGEMICTIYDSTGTSVVAGGSQYTTRQYSSLSANTIGGPLAMAWTFRQLAAGDYIVQAQCRAWCSGSAVANCLFSIPYLTVTVTGKE